MVGNRLTHETKKKRGRIRERETACRQEKEGGRNKGCIEGRWIGRCTDIDIDGRCTKDRGSIQVRQDHDKTQSTSQEEMTRRLLEI